MKIGCVCPTYKRPALLGRAIHCFLQQDYEHRELIVLDDAGQYETGFHHNWSLVSTAIRYPTLGMKRMAGVEMLSKDCDAYMVWDDDDVYFPWAIGCVAKALREGPWAQCRIVYETLQPGRLHTVRAFGSRERAWGYGGCWAYRLPEFIALGGYDDDCHSNDDVDLATKFWNRHGESADSTSDGRAWYWYNRDPGVGKIAQEGVGFWEIRARFFYQPMAGPPVDWNGPDMYALPIEPGVDVRPF